MKDIAVTADLHLQGKNLTDKQAALKQAVDKILAIGTIRTVYFAGDTFHRRNISDREATTGLIYKVLMEQLNRLIDAGIAIVMVEGNGIHEGRVGDQPGPLETLKRQGITVVDDGYAIMEHNNNGPFNAETVVACLPAVDNEQEYATLKNTLKVVKGCFDKNPNVYKIIIHHLSISGSTLPSGMELTGANFEVSAADLEATGADLIIGGHVHKRQKYYVGALCQDNFGDEGNPQGFAVIDTEKRTVEYVEIDAPRYYTGDQVKAELFIPNNIDYFKLRCKVKPDNYDELLKNPRVTIEIIPEREVIKREVEGVEAGRTDAELLDAYLVSKGTGDADRQRIGAVARGLK